MNDNDFAVMTARINNELVGKTIKRATYECWGMGYAVTLHFTDGTCTEIRPEHDEGFVFSSPVQNHSNLLFYAGAGGDCNKNNPLPNNGIDGGFGGSDVGYHIKPK